MTIAAGFVTRNGILICADTQYTGGAKIYKPKVQPFTLNDETLLVFALAGHTDYGQMAIEECLESVNAIPQAQRSMTKVRKAMQSVLVDVNRLIDACPEQDRDLFRFELLVGVYRNPYKPKLFVTRRTSIRTVETRECIGTGEYLAGYLLASHQRGASMKDTLLLATRMLYYLKQYDANCGGYSHFAIIGRNGFLQQQEWSTTEVVEKYIPRLEAWTSVLLNRLADPMVTEDEFAADLERFDAAMNQLKSGGVKTQTITTACRNY